VGVTFSITSEDAEDGVRVVAVAGEIDLFTAQQLKDRMSDAIDSGRVRLLVDLGGTTFIDSSGLGALIGAYGRVRARGGLLVLCCVDDEISRTFELTGLDQVLTVVPSRSDALAELARPGAR
jgi:anti-sigma B factor antagonist